MATPDRPKAAPSKSPARPAVVPPPIVRRAPGAPGPAEPAPPPPPPPLASAIVGSLKDVAKASFLEKRPYLKYAFANPYNLTLFGGMLAAAGLTLNPLLAITAVGLESLWLLYAPDSKRLRHLLWDPRFEQVRQALLADERRERLALLAPPERKRVDALIARQADIHRLAAQNPSFTGDLLRSELTKTERLADAFIDMAVTSVRYDAYLGSVDVDAIDADRERLEGAIEAGKLGDRQVELARRNLAIILKRLEKMREIRRYLDVARGQLDLIENSFQLIADNIVTMQSPQELTGQLNELLDGVESIRQTAAETEAILSTVA
jgi:hypothetical protein